jgi:uncharacterized protein YsxB (DUF464 family)
MTHVTIFINEDKECVGFQIEDHAGYADQGEDIVCAAISTLVINTINSIEAFTGTVPIVETDEKSGYIHCSFEESITNEAALLLDSMILGLSQIKEQYGTKYIDVKIKEV